MKIKKIVAVVVSAVMLTTSYSFNKEKEVEVSAAPYLNYAEALQKSLYFYEIQQAGELPDWNRVEWRADSLLDYKIPGGWYDAGDLLKFNLPMSYSANMLAWGMYMYPEGLKEIGQYETYRLNLEWALDYFAACDLGDEFVYGCGDTTLDHANWQSVEVAEYGYGDGDFYDVSGLYDVGKDSAVGAMMSAALSSGYLAVKDDSPAKAAGYLEHAINLFNIADATRSDSEYNANSNIAGIYASSHFYDNLFYAANWLYMATKDDKYLAKAEEYIPNLPKAMGTQNVSYDWGMCWDDATQGGVLLYAINTGDNTWIEQARKQVEYWTNDVKELDGGLRWLTNWGCIRHATAAAFTAQVACDTIFKNDSKRDTYIDFAETQVNYALGDNPNDFSYLVGYGENYPQSPHSRTAHATWMGAAQREPVANRHIVYGALVGGPDESGTYVDDRNEYIYTEITTDYNAGFTAMLCALVDKYGGETDPTFPLPEEKNNPAKPDTLELFVTTEITEDSANGTTVKFNFNNHTAWPTRIVDNITFRYYMDLSEVIAAGKNPEDIVIRCDRDESKMRGYVTQNASWTQPVQYKGDIYYVEISLPDGRAALPVADDLFDSEVILAFVMPEYGTGWDSSNDPSRKGLVDGEEVINQNVTVYENGTLVFGIEPDGTTVDPGKSTTTTTKATTTTTKATTTTTKITTTGDKPTGKCGDIDLDGAIKLADIVTLAKVLNSTLKISGESLANADCDATDSKINAADLAVLIGYVLGQYTTLPYTG
ncbi:MAG: glycoside hydrolase family 9 protein [Oscillospiraceae bacterium]|jgi:hypothetical protein|nr:glycoside hydrolase family 9 protein [Oscillospiraceae bacterium]